MAIKIERELRAYLPYHFRDKVRISVENRTIFPSPCILYPCWRGYPSNLILALVVKKTRVMGYWAKQEVWWYLQPSGYNPRTWPMDTGQQQRPCLHTASGGKNYTKTKTEIAWFSHRLWHPARKWSGSILTTRNLHGPILPKYIHRDIWGYYSCMWWPAND